MEIISSISELRQRLCGEISIAFVPTMGNLHEGHLNLVKLAREHGNCVVASIFVNPLQFGPSEDFDRYPRTLEADCAQLQGLADLVFAPAVDEMYPLRQTVFVDPPPVANELCGASRPGHFRGMATVVLKLLNIVQPQGAVFGKKDYQQLHILHGERDFERLQQGAVEALAARGWLPDYVAVRSQSDLQPASPAQGSTAQRELAILAAARLGNTRLLDNVEVCLVD